MYHTLLVPLDGSALSEGALPMAKALARRANARLVLVRAAWLPALVGARPTETQTRAVQEAQDYLARLAAELQQQDFRVETIVPQAPPDKAIVNAVALAQADLVVMTTHGRSGLGRWLYGSVAEAVLRRSPVPVLLVRAWSQVEPDTLERGAPRLIVPLDGSRFAEAALRHAETLAWALGDSLVLMRALVPAHLPADPLVAQALLEKVELDDEAEAYKYLTACAAPLRAAGLTVRTAVRSGNAATAIIEEAWAAEASLIVMATHGCTGLERVLMGSVAQEVLKRGTLPLLLVHPYQVNGGPGAAHVTTETQGEPALQAH